MADIMEDDPSSGLQSSEEEEEIPVESLVKGRAKRSTAGLHMSALLEAAADDDLALLFEEVEDDNEFADVADPDAEDDLALDSSDDDDDQGPNAQNDYEGEQKLQREERKKRKTQNDLRFQTLRKRVKIDPTAPSAMAAPRPKKKSERISWIPTLEDGPTRQSSRRQTMVNKELTHARLKDSQEKRVRIIATMKEAEKRKAHLKPKEMTQEDHLTEAARIERLNSKSLNRWELSEKRKADERRARIEALQNRRLDGPVISYWSGVATWTNGRLTRVGKIDIKPKPDKEESKKKKKEKEEKEKAAAELKVLGPPTAAAISSASVTTPSQLVPNPSAVEMTSAPDPALSTLNSSLDPNIAGAKPASEKPASEHTGAPTTGNTEAPVVPTGPSAGQPDTNLLETKILATNSTEPGKDIAVENNVQEVDTSVSEPPSKQEKAKPNERQPSDPLKSTERRLLAVEIPAPRPLSKPPGKDSTRKLPGPDPAKNDAMDVEQSPAAAAGSNAAHTNKQASDSKDQTILATSNTANAQPTSTEIPEPGAAASTVREQPLVSESRPVGLTIPVSPGIALSPEVSSATTAPSQAPVPENASISSLNQPSPVPIESQPTNGIVTAPAQPDILQPPPVIENTGRSLTILENFDYATANHRKYSMYFNAKKLPRLTKISSSLCVITSLPSRYRDPETALPYANSYAYGQIRRMLSEGYIWSSMLGCFVGPAEAARGVPERFTGKPGPGTVKYEPETSNGQAESSIGKGINPTPSNGEVSSTPPATQPIPEPMEVDKP